MAVENSRRGYDVVEHRFVEAALASVKVALFERHGGSALPCIWLLVGGICIRTTVHIHNDPFALTYDSQLAHFTAPKSIKRKERAMLVPFLFGGSGGSRTLVRKSVDTAFSGRSQSFESRLTVRRMTGLSLDQLFFA